jgi:hypothetical protein
MIHTPYRWSRVARETFECRVLDLQVLGPAAFGLMVGDHYGLLSTGQSLVE